MSTRSGSRCARRRLGASAAVALFTLAACGGGGDDVAGTEDVDPDPSAQTATSDPETCHRAPGVLDEVMRVGGLYPTTGPEGAFFAAVGPGIEARFAAENAAGGIAGRELVLVHADDGDGEIANAGAAEHLVETEEVFGLIQVSSSSEGSAKYLHDNGIPVVGWAITPSWGRFENMFGYRHSTSPNPEGGRPVSLGIGLVKHRGGTKLAILASGIGAATNQADHARATAVELDVDVVYENGNVPLGADDFRLEAEQIKESGADAVYLAVQTLASVKLLTALADAGVEPDVIVMGAGYDARVPQAFGDVLGGVLIPIDWRPFELGVPAHEDFRRWLAEIDPDAFPGQLAMVGWLAADVFIRGVYESGPSCPERERFVDGLRAVTDHTADGLLPPTDYAAEFGQLPRCFWYVEVVGDGFAPVDEEPLCSVEVPAGYGAS